MPFEAVRAISLNASAAAIRIARFVVVGASAQAAEAGGGTADVDGVSLEAVAVSNAGLAFAAAAPDGAKVEVAAGAAVTAGDLVMSDAQGRAITATATNNILGRALTAAGAADEVITILFSKGAGVA